MVEYLSVYIPMVSACNFSLINAIDIFKKESKQGPMYEPIMCLFTVIYLVIERRKTSQFCIRLRMFTIFNSRKIM